MYLEPVRPEGYTDAEWEQELKNDWNRYVRFAHIAILSFTFGVPLVFLVVMLIVGWCQ